MAAITDSTTMASSFFPLLGSIPSLPTSAAALFTSTTAASSISPTSASSTTTQFSLSGLSTPISPPNSYYPFSMFGNFGSGIGSNTPQMFLPSSGFDCTIKVMYTDDESHKSKEEVILSHKQILAKSGFFRQQLLTTLTNFQSQFFIDLTMIPDALNNFRTLLMFLYTGNINTVNSNNETLLNLVKLLQVPELEEQLRALCEAKATSNSNSNNFPFSSIISTMANSIAQNSDPTQSQLCNLYAQYFLQAQLASSSSSPPNFGMSLNSMTPNLPSPLEANDAASFDRSPTDSASMLFPSTTPPESDTSDQLIVSNDKEGWCRNKKYIETVPNGYRCTVCRKVYGRYNSVSYHVTIYHRNPPIRCGVEGCPFTTREARYIHFHKYYRHGIKLPESIDLASRKCGYCRHISKSPAMLEKHICRHVQDCLKNGKTYTCLKCNHESDNQKSMYEHLREHQLQAVEEQIKASKRAAGIAVEESGPSSPSSRKNVAADPCPARLVKMFKCEYCIHESENELQLQQHKIFNHTSQILDTAQQPNPLTLFAWQQFLLTNSNFSQPSESSSTDRMNNAQSILPQQDNTCLTETSE
jgi:hypothetical protein